jgi:hypothetical protein
MVRFGAKKVDASPPFLLHQIWGGEHSEPYYFLMTLASPPFLCAKLKG